jgi:hypothetical protein
MGCCFTKNKVADVETIVNNRKRDDEPVKADNRPIPIKKKRDQILKWKEYIEKFDSDSRMKQYCLSKRRVEFRSLEELVDFFRVARATIAQHDIELAWCIYVWVTHNVEYDGEGFRCGEYKDQSAESVLRTGLSVCAGYANIYKHLCTENRIECLRLSGHSKGFGFKPGQSFEGKATDHAWNAIRLKQKW